MTIRRALAAVAALVTLGASSCTAAPGATPGPGGTATADTASPSPSPSSTPPAPAPVPATTFRYGAREPTAILPGDVMEPDGLVISDTLFDSLTAWDPDGAVGDGAATTWFADRESRVWTFTLRPGATWADDARTPVTAADFVFAWTRAVAEGRAGGYHLDEVEGYDELVTESTTTLAGVTAVDERTLEVRLRSPFAEFPAVVAHPALGPLHQARYVEDPGGYARTPIGNGPFVTQTWQPGGFLRATRSPAWRNGPRPALDEVVFQFGEAEDAFIAFQQDRFDYAPLPSGALAGALERYGRAAEGYRGPGVLDGPAPQLYFLGMDVASEPFDRVEVRRALSLALDREAIAAAVREGNADPALGAVPQVIPGARSRPCDYCRYDPDTARELFAQAGVTQVELWFNREGGHEQIANLVADQLTEVGVRLRSRTPRAPDDGASALDAYLEQLRGETTPLFRFGWTMDYPLLDDGLRPLFASALANTQGAANYGPYIDSEVDALLAQARGTRNAAQRERLYQAAEDAAIDGDQAIIPLLHFRHAAVVGERFEGFVLSPFGLPNLAEVRPAAAPSEG